MFLKQSAQELPIEGDNYNENDQSQQQSIFLDQHQTIKEKQSLIIPPNSYLNHLLQESTLLPEKESSKRIVENKIKYKKLKQKLNLLSEQILDQGLLKDQKDITSPNKSRLLKLALELQKSIKTQAIDYQLVESLLKEIQKIVEHKREHDLLILRGARVMTTLLGLVKRFPSLHRNEAMQSMVSLELSLRLLRIMLSLSSSRQLLLISNQMTVISTLLSCALMREEKKIATSCLVLLNLVFAVPNKIQLNEIINANLQYMLCSSLLKRLKSYLETCITEDDPSHAEFVLLGFKFCYYVMGKCCEKELARPIYGTPVMDNLSRAISCYFQSMIQLLSFSLTELIFQKEVEQQKYFLRDEQIPNFKINVFIYIFKSLNIIFHVNFTFSQKVIECNSIFINALLFVFNYAKDNFKQSHEIKGLCSEIIVFIGNLACENEIFQNLMRESGLLASICNHPLEYMMEPLKHIFVPAFCCLIHNNPQNYKEAFKQNSVLTILQYIEKQIIGSIQKKIEDDPCFEINFHCSKSNQCKTLSRKTSVSSMNSNYSKASMADSYTTQASLNSVVVNKQIRLDYKFRPQFWQQMGVQLKKIDD